MKSKNYTEWHFFHFNFFINAFFDLQTSLILPIFIWKLDPYEKLTKMENTQFN
jgi:hypothetical protein